MRTTITLDPDVDALIRRRMHERRLSFKQAINDALRAGLRPERPAPFRTETVSMGQPVVNLDRALQLAGELEDEELFRTMRNAG